MARKNVTTKADISSWYVKRIKNFENLTEQEALFEYEAIKLRERYRKQAKTLQKKGKSVQTVAPKIVRPSAVTPSDVDYLKRIESQTIKEAIYRQEPIVPSYSGLYDYETSDWKEKNLPDFSWDEELYYSDDFGDSEDDYLTESDIKRIEDSFDKPEPKEPLFVDESTGEAIFEEDLPDFVQRSKELIDDLIAFTEQQADQSIVSYSAYRSGRTKTSASRKWSEDNINRAKNKIINRLEQIKDGDELAETFARKCASSDYLDSLYDAIGEYLAQAYSDTTGASYNSSSVYSLLNFSPMTLDDTMEFEDEE